MTTKTKKTLLLTGILSAVLISYMGFNTANANPDQENETDVLKEKLKDLDWHSLEYFELIKRDSLTDSELTTAKQIAISDTRVSDALNSEPLKINSVGFIGNPTEIPVKWNPVLHANIGDQSVSIIVDLEDRKVIKVDSMDQYSLDSSGAASNAYAVAEYTGDESVLKGIEIVSPTQPTNYDGDEMTNGFVALIVNAMMYNSNPADICTASEDEDSYWMQAGTHFNEDGWRYVFADTNSVNPSGEGCNAIPIMGLSQPSITDDMRFTIYTSGSTWYALFYNLSDPELEYESDTAPSSGNIATDTYETSVFMENNYNSTGWTSQFSDTTLSITDARVSTNGINWIDWDTESSYIIDCNGSTQTNDVITGSLVSGSTATWDVDDMEDWEACD